jgi:quercetin dioxygenase-like cupin family protein
MYRLVRMAALVMAFTQIGAFAHAQEGVVRRQIISQIEIPGLDYIVVQVMAFTIAGGVVARHTHPGVESSYILEGEADLLVEGQPDRHVKAGDSFLVPPNTPHTLKNGPAPAKVLVTFVVQKNKPLATPAPQ